MAAAQAEAVALVALAGVVAPEEQAAAAAAALVALEEEVAASAAALAVALEEEAAAAAALAAGGWVFPPHVNTELFALAAGQDAFPANFLRLSTLKWMGEMANEVWHRRAVELEMHNLISFRRETTAIRRHFGPLRLSAQSIAFEVIENGGIPVATPEALRVALAGLELPAAEA